MALLLPVRVFMILIVYIFSRIRLLLQHVLSRHQKTLLLYLASLFLQFLGTVAICCRGEPKEKKGEGMRELDSVCLASLQTMVGF